MRIKLGPVTVALQASGKPATGELGAPAGVTRYGRRGFQVALTEVDYLEAMRPPGRWATVAKMMSDDAVGAAVRAMTLPVLATSFAVEPGGKGATAKELADFIQADLDGLSGGLFKHRAEALGFLAEGVRVFEKVFEYREDKRRHLRKLALRPCSSIIEWQVDEHGGPVGVVQLGTDSQEIELDIARLLVFTNEGEGANLVGRSILRSAYKPWWYKDKLERVAYIAAERGAVGVPVGTQVGDDEEVTAAIEAILQGVRAHESGFVREDDRFKFRIEGLTGNRVDPLPLLVDFRRSIFVSVLADFLALGDGSGGSWALSRDKSSFFVMALGAVLEQLQGTYNRHLLAPWVRENWGDIPTAELPRVTHGPLNTRNIGEWVEALGVMVERGVLPPDEQMAAMAREVLELPETPGAEGPADLTPEERAAQLPVEAGDKPAPEPAPVQAAAGQAPRLESLVKVEALGIEVRFKEIEGTLDRGEGRMVERLTKLQEKAAKRLASRAAKLVNSGAWDKLADERAPSDEEAAAIEEELLLLYGFGADEYGRELASQGVKPSTVEDKDSKASLAVLLAFAAFAGARLSDRLGSALGAGVFGSFGAGRLNPDSLAAGMVDGVGRLLADLARQGASLAHGLGRGDAGKANADKVAWEIYSTALDAHVCDVCAPFEGMGLAVNEPPRCPNPNCLGGSRCRCVRIPVAEQTEGRIQRSEEWRRDWEARNRPASPGADAGADE